MKRRGCSRDDIKRVWRAYRMLFYGDGTFERAQVPPSSGSSTGIRWSGRSSISSARREHRALMIAERSGTAAEAADAADAGS